MGRMPRLPPPLALLLALALSLPGAAMAQDAGDEQYADPFGGGGNDEPSTQPRRDDAPAAPARPPVTEATPTPAQAGPAQAPPAPPRAQLPRTGGEGGLLAAAGLTLLAGGIALRRLAR